MSDHDCTLETCGIEINLVCDRCVPGDLIVFARVRWAHAPARRTLHELAHYAATVEWRPTQRGATA